MTVLNGSNRKRGRDLLGVALVGLGRSGQFHLTSIRTLCHMCKLVWAIDVDLEKAKTVAEEMDCKYDTKIDDAVRDPEVHIVIIASTTDTHFPFIMKALGAYKAVLAEKPISHNAKEVEQAVDLAVKNGKPFICGYQRRCDHNFQKLKRDIDSGKIGTMKMLKSCSRDNPVPPMEYLRTSGGIFQDMLIHDFDMHDWLTGGDAPVSVTATGHCYTPEIAAFNDLDTVCVMCKYTSGLVSMIDTCRDATYGYDQRMEVFGSKGMLHVHNEPVHRVEFADSSGFQTSPALWSFPERYKDAYLHELDMFLRLVRAGPDSDEYQEEIQQMKRHARIVRQAIAAELSWRLNRTVQMSEDLDKLAEEHIPHHPESPHAT